MTKTKAEELDSYKGGEITSEMIEKAKKSVHLGDKYEMPTKADSHTSGARIMTGRVCGKYRYICDMLFKFANGESFRQSYPWWAMVRRAKLCR